MTLAAPPLSNAVLLPLSTTFPQNKFPSTPHCPLTSMPTRTARLSRVVQRASRTVRAHNPGSHWRMLKHTRFYFALLFFPPVEERVGSSEVQGRLYLNKVFHISANKMFEMLFTNSNFFRRFMDIRKIMSKCQTCFNHYLEVLIYRYQCSSLWTQLMNKK